MAALMLADGTCTVYVVWTLQCSDGQLFVRVTDWLMDRSVVAAISKQAYNSAVVFECAVLCLRPSCTLCKPVQLMASYSCI